MEGRSLSREDKATLPTLMEGSGVPEDRLRLLLVLYLHPGLFGSFLCVLSVAHASCQGCECCTADLVSSYDRPVPPIRHRAGARGGGVRSHVGSCRRQHARTRLPEKDECLEGHAKRRA